MKLIRFGEINKEKTGIIINGKYFDTSAFEEDYDEQFFGSDGLTRLKKFIELNKSGLQEIPADIRLGSPIARPSKIICIGLNYADHAKETNAKIPTEPIIFFKSTTALCGPYDDVIIPKKFKESGLGSRVGSNNFKKNFLCGRKSGFRCRGRLLRA